VVQRKKQKTLCSVISCNFIDVIQQLKAFDVSQRLPKHCMYVLKLYIANRVSVASCERTFSKLNDKILFVF